MQDLKIFKNNEFGEIRTALVNNEPYFMLSDVCRVLEINNSRQAKTRLSEYGVITNDVIDSMGRNQKADFINESNLYKLVFQSRKPQAEKFSDWVTGEVLPAIRKHGAYMTEQTIEKALTSPDFLIDLATKLKQEQEARKALENKVEKDKPKVLFANSVETATNSCLVGELAKIISQNGMQIGQNRLFKWLRNNGYLISRKGESFNLPTQYSMDLGLMEIKKRTINNPNGTVRTTSTTKVTGKGQIYFVNKFLKQEIA